VSFSYRTRWFAPSVLSRGFALEGEQAVIVFCAKPDEQATDFVYLPLRHVTIKALRPHEVVSRQLVDDDTYIAIDFELGDFVNVNDSVLSDLEPRWQQWLALPDRPQPRQRESHWVLEADEVPAGGPVADQNTPWQTLSTRLAQFPSLEGSYFFRVAGIQRRHDAGTETWLDPRKQANAPPRYDLKTLDEYVLRLEAYSRAGGAFMDVLAPTTSDLLTATDPVTSTIGQATRLDIYLRTGPVQREETAILLLRGKEGFEDKTPSVALISSVQPRYALVVTLLLLVAVGVAVAGLNWRDFGVSPALTVVLKVAGALLVSGALFLAARSAPGVTR
jgi:hypothetical protein